MDAIRSCMKEILSKEWYDVDEHKNMLVWESIANKKLTATPAFVGKKYGENNNRKIMFVGHALNGWDELDVSGCETLEKTLDAILSQNDGLSTIVNKESSYKHCNSKFWRLIKQILEYQGQSEASPSTDETWYNDPKEWNERIIWSNLYNVAPRYGKNPENKFIKPCMAQYTAMMKAQIEEFTPDVVVFCPNKGYFTPWKREPSFADILEAGSYETFENNGPIIGKGKIGKTHIIICERPDRRRPSKSFADVQKMAKEISDYIDKLCKN